MTICQSKSLVLRQSVRFKGRSLNALQCIHHRLFFPSWPALCGICPILFTWQHHCCNNWSASTAYKKWQIDNLKHSISKIVLNFKKTYIFVEYFYVQIKRTGITSSKILLQRWRGQQLCHTDTTNETVIKLLLKPKFSFYTSAPSTSHQSKPYPSSSSSLVASC